MNHMKIKLLISSYIYDDVSIHRCICLTKKFATYFNRQNFLQRFLSLCLNHDTNPSRGREVEGKERTER